MSNQFSRKLAKIYEKVIKIYEEREKKLFFQIIRQKVN